MEENNKAEQAVEIVLKFNLDEVNTILGVLGKSPYEMSAAIIDNIRRQAIAQLPANPVVEKPAE